jgi:amidase
MASKTIKKENLKYLMTANDDFVAQIEPGEEVSVDCDIAFNGSVVSSFDVQLTNEDFRYPYFNPMTGPIEVKGAKAGQMLCVKIKAIELDEFGLTGLMPHSGLFQEWIFERQQEFCNFKLVRVSDGMIHWDEKRKIPTAPMVGVIGVAPAFGSILSIDNGDHGGNIDVQELGPGATIYLPVNVDGGYLYLGDCHARQGDGEISGVGAIDIGARVTISVGVEDRPKRMSWPRYEDETHVGTIGLGRTIEEAMRISCREMIYWMADDFGFTEPDAYTLLSSVLEGRATQVMNPKVTYLCKVRKDFIR